MTQEQIEIICRIIGKMLSYNGDAMPTSEIKSIVKLLEKLRQSNDTDSNKH